MPAPGQETKGGPGPHGLCLAGLKLLLGLRLDLRGAGSQRLPLLRVPVRDREGRRHRAQCLELLDFRLPLELLLHGQVLLSAPISSCRARSFCRWISCSRMASLIFWISCWRTISRCRSSSCWRTSCCDLCLPSLRGGALRLSARRTLLHFVRAPSRLGVRRPTAPDRGRGQDHPRAVRRFALGDPAAAGPRGGRDGRRGGQDRPPPRRPYWSGPRDDGARARAVLFRRRQSDDDERVRAAALDVGAAYLFSWRSRKRRPAVALGAASASCAVWDFSTSTSMFFFIGVCLRAIRLLTRDAARDRRARRLVAAGSRSRSSRRPRLASADRLAPDRRSCTMRMRPRT